MCHRESGLPAPLVLSEVTEGVRWRWGSRGVQGVTGAANRSLSPVRAVVGGFYIRITLHAPSVFEIVYSLVEF